jgi:putative phage-type endonuclease
MGEFKIVSIDKNTDYQGWLDFRQNGIGASEIGTLLGLNPYKSKIELFYQKLGVIPQMQEENVVMFYGNRLEDFVASMWEYYSGTPESIVENFNKQEKQRHAKSVSGYILNSDYPEMFFSPDRLIVSKDTDKVIYNNKLVAKNITGILEIKTISGFASKQWEGGIPPSYIIQVTAYMIGLEQQYAEIALFEDGRKFNVLPVHRNEALVEKILSEVQDFTDRVNAAKGDMANVHLYEPEPDGTQAFEQFLNKKYALSQDKTMQGNKELLELAVRHKMAADELKQKESEVREYTNMLKNCMKEFEAIDFGSSGKVVWKTDSRGIRAMRNNIQLGKNKTN